MQALGFDPDAPGGLRLGDAPDPVPGRSQAQVRIAATSLNFADVAFLADRKAPGAIPGFGWRGPWQQAAEAAAALMGRQVRGKAILEVSTQR